MNVSFSYGKRTYELKADDNNYILSETIESQDGETYQQNYKYLNNLKSVFDVLEKHALKQSDAKTLKNLRKDLRKFHNWSKNNFDIFKTKLETPQKSQSKPVSTVLSA